MAFIHFLALLAVFQYLLFVARTGQARDRYHIKAPAVTGDENFERVYRVQMNTLEQLGGAAGTAILVAAMTVASKYALDSGDAPTTAMASGASTAFIVGTLVGVATLVTVLFAAGKTTNNAELASDG